MWGRLKQWRRNRIIARAQFDDRAWRLALQRFPFTRPLSPEERERLWATLTAIAPGYLEYQRRTRREIPMGILQPAP